MQKRHRHLAMVYGLPALAACLQIPAEGNRPLHGDTMQQATQDSSVDLSSDKTSSSVRVGTIIHAQEPQTLWGL